MAGRDGNGFFKRFKKIKHNIEQEPKTPKGDKS